MIPKITGRISANAKNKVYENLSFLQNRVGHGSIVRGDLPAPALFLLDALRNEWIEPPEYKSDHDMLAFTTEDQWHKIDQLFSLLKKNH